MGAVAFENELSAQTADFMRRNLVWDNHGCMPLTAAHSDFLPQLERYRQSGVNIVSLNVGYDADPPENTILVLGHFRRWIRRFPDEYLLVEKASDIDLAVKTGRLGVMFDIEGGCALRDSLGMVEAYYELGVRWMLIAYNLNNALGGGCQDDDQGLTKFGRAVVREMERVGMVVCCSHTGFRTTMDVMQCANRPVIFSHSNPLGVWKHKRNIGDEAIKACAATGGVIGINGIGCFLGRNDARTETIVRHIDYVVQLVGPEHVGISLDYVFDQQELNDHMVANPQLFPPELGYTPPLKLVRPEQIPEMVEGLTALGYSDSHLRLILGENHLRIARQVWK